MKRLLIGCLESIDPYTKLLLHFDGVSGATTIVDSSPEAHTITQSGIDGNVVISTAQSKFGGSSGYWSARNALDCGVINIGTQAFCIEMWVYCASASSYIEMLCAIGSSDSAIASGFAFSPHSSHTDMFGLWYSTFASSALVSTNISIGVWHHIALVGNGGASGSRTIKKYLDGVSVGGTLTVDYNYNDHIIVGANIDWGQNHLVGYMDEFRLSVGTQRYTADFTPPTAQFSA